AALALVAFSLFLALRFTRKQTIRITQNALVVCGGRDRTIAAGEVVQLFARHLEDPPFGYQVMANLEGGETVVLVGNLDRFDQARYVERQIEETLGLANEPVAAELGRDAPAEQLLDRSRIPATLASVGVVIATVTLVVSSRGCVQPIGVLPVSIGGGETSLEVDLDRARSLRVLADVTVSGAYVSRTTSKQRSSEDLPNTLRVEIVIDH